MQITDQTAIEFARYVRNNPYKIKEWKVTVFEEGEIVSDNTKTYDNIEELFEEFLKTKQ